MTLDLRQKIIIDPPWLVRDAALTECRFAGLVRQVDDVVDAKSCNGQRQTIPSTVSPYLETSTGGLSKSQVENPSQGESQEMLCHLKGRTTPL